MPTFIIANRHSGSVGLEPYSNPQIFAKKMSFKYVGEEILAQVRKFHENEKTVEQKSELAKAEFEKGAEQYWKDTATNEISNLLSKPDLWKSNPELAETITKKLNENRELIRYQKLEALQSDVFTRYLEKHLSDVSESKRADVEKNGWL